MRCYLENTGHLSNDEFWEIAIPIRDQEQPPEKEMATGETVKVTAELWFTTEGEAPTRIQFEQLIYDQMHDALDEADLRCFGVTVTLVSGEI
jgi:hypothetical protein